MQLTQGDTVQLRKMLVKSVKQHLNETKFDAAAKIYKILACTYKADDKKHKEYKNAAAGCRKMARA